MRLGIGERLVTVGELAQLRDMVALVNAEDFAARRSIHDHAGMHLLPPVPPPPGNEAVCELWTKQRFIDAEIAPRARIATHSNPSGLANCRPVKKRYLDRGAPWRRF
jgi:hypothetical protein